MLVGDVADLLEEQVQVGAVALGPLGIGPAVEPDQRAEKTPGDPPSTSTASPESSATAGSPVAVGERHAP